MCLEESHESTLERIVGSREAMKAFKRRISMLVYRIQQLSKGSNEGSGIIPEVPDKPKDNSDVPIHQEDTTIQRTPLINTVILMVTKNTTSTPTPPTIQAQVTNGSEFVSSSKFEQRLLELQMKVKTMPKRAWTEKDQKMD
ncbi:hypothetical protein Tco_1439160 [Tanacetum coccineum]